MGGPWKTNHSLDFVQEYKHYLVFDHLGTAIQLAKADLLLFICLAYFYPIYDRIVAKILNEVQKELDREILCYLVAGL